MKPEVCLPIQIHRGDGGYSGAALITPTHQPVLLPLTHKKLIRQLDIVAGVLETDLFAQCVAGDLRLLVPYVGEKIIPNLLIFYVFSRNQPDIGNQLGSISHPGNNTLNFLKKYRLVGR